MKTIDAHIADLSDQDLRALSALMANGVEAHRGIRRPLVAALYDTLGRLLDNERDWRAGRGGTLDGEPLVVAAIHALPDTELFAVACGLASALEDCPKVQRPEGVEFLPESGEERFLAALFTLAGQEWSKRGNLTVGA